jgi:superfamily II DNA/RNA helicase|tara:strand:- start:800 stop:1309 length:510 start_codon:yes stop_codon:yes gene_type:complete
VASLHGDLPQPARDATLANLRSGEVDVLVATDVAARGLDLPGVELVVHADMPKSADTYSHRAGRAGRPGCAVPGVSLLISRPELASEITRLEREAKVSIRRLVFIGERERVVVTGDLGASVSTLEPESRESAPARRDDSLIADHFARFADDIQNIATSKKKGKSKSRGK